MRAYVAGPYPAKENLKARAKDLEIIGFDVRARWLDEPGVAGPALQVPEDERFLWASRDLEDIATSDALVMFTPMTVGLPDCVYEARTGGRHIETGYALALGKEIVVVGCAENIFHVWPNVKVVSDWRDAMIHLNELLRSQRGRRR